MLCSGRTGPNPDWRGHPEQKGGNVSPQELTAITKDAWLYAYAPLKAYQALYNQTQNAADPAYTGGFNRFKHLPIDAPQASSEPGSGQSQTALSWAWLDLRNEPVVLSLPAEPSRAYVNQWFDLHNHNFANTGSEITGREAGNYLFAGPRWKGETPNGITRVIRSETEFIATLTRVQSLGADDATALKAFQSGLKVQPLSVYAGTSAPTAKALTLLPWDSGKARAMPFVSYLNAMLPFMPTVSSETEMMTRFAKIGIGAGKSFDADKLKPEIRQAMEQGISQAQAELQANALPQGDYGLWTNTN